MAQPVKITAPVRLGDLIDAIEHAQPDALQRVSQAVLTGEALGDVADQLIGHFVDQARRSGASWTEIGRSMGVTKQAVQKRFAARTEPQAPADPQQGFAQFSPRARDVVVAAQNHATDARNERITPAHLLLGLLDEAGGTGARALAAAGADAGALRTAARATLPPAADEAPALVPFDEDAKAVLEETFAVAQRLGHPVVGTGDLLLALAGVPAVRDLLAGQGVDARSAEQHVLGLAAEA
ncbi:Clp protease N-terminal domain-containing protein [Kineococcus sp. NUM-3379]